MLKCFQLARNQLGLSVQDGPIIQNTQDLTDFILLKDKPFYFELEKDHNKIDCCFNHLVGMPVKNGVTHELYEYERQMFLSLQQGEKYLWVKKATGLGLTEFTLRYMAWLCVYDDTYQKQKTQFCIVTGPNEALAIGLIQRFKDLFQQYHIFDTDKKTAIIGNVTIHAYPSNHLDSMRSLKNPRFIFLDEADFFRIGEQQNARKVSERYIGKSDPIIMMVSTPNRPRGLFETMEKEIDSIYKKFFFPYTVGLGNIFSEQDIEEAKRSANFEQEYNLKYVGIIGNVFHTQDIERSITDQYEPHKINPYTERSMGIDPGYGSSPFGICITEYQDEKIWIKYAEDFERPDFNDMLNLVLKLNNEYQIKKIYVDGANASFIRSLKTALSERKDYENIPKDQHRYMKVIPIPFSTNHRSMLQYSKQVLEADYIRIHPKFEKLIISLNTAIEQDGKLDKDQTSYNDVYDAFRLSLLRYQPQSYNGDEIATQN